jgi:hypothetical protein
VTNDPRKAQTLGEACDNGDGTFNGLKLLSWLSEITAPGKGLSLDEVAKIADEVKRRRD